MRTQYRVQNPTHAGEAACARTLDSEQLQDSTQSSAFLALSAPSVTIRLAMYQHIHLHDTQNVVNSDQRPSAHITQVENGAAALDMALEAVCSVNAPGLWHNV